MDEVSKPEGQDASRKRAKLLSVLCILTFIWSGLNIFSSLIIGAFFNTFQVLAADLAEQFPLPGLELLLNAPRSFFLLTGLLYIGSLTGAILMWRLRKTGFHVYTIAQILLLIAPMYFLKLPGPSILDLVFSGLFIILYSTQLKSMNEHGR